MTQKELLYCEDILNHCKLVKQAFKSSTKTLSSDKLRKESTEFEEWTTKIYNSVYDLIK